MAASSLTPSTFLDQAQLSAKLIVCEWIRQTLHETFLQGLQLSWKVTTTANTNNSDDNKSTYTSAAPSDNPLFRVEISRDTLNNVFKFVERLCSKWKQYLMQSSQYQISQWIDEVYKKGKSTLWSSSTKSSNNNDSDKVETVVRDTTTNNSRSNSETTTATQQTQQPRADVSVDNDDDDDHSSSSDEEEERQILDKYYHIPNKAQARKQKQSTQHEQAQRERPQATQPPRPPLQLPYTKLRQLGKRKNPPPTSQPSGEEEDSSSRSRDISANINDALNTIYEMGRKGDAYWPSNHWNDIEHNIKYNIPKRLYSKERASTNVDINVTIKKKEQPPRQKQRHVTFASGDTSTNNSTSTSTRRTKKKQNSQQQGDDEEEVQQSGNDNVTMSDVDGEDYDDFNQQSGSAATSDTVEEKEFDEEDQPMQSKQQEDALKLFLQNKRQKFARKSSRSRTSFNSSSTDVISDDPPRLGSDVEHEIYTMEEIVNSFTSSEIKSLNKLFHKEETIDGNVLNPRQKESQEGDNSKTNNINNNGKDSISQQPLILFGALKSVGHVHYYLQRLDQGANLDEEDDGGRGTDGSPQALQAPGGLGTTTPGTTNNNNDNTATEQQQKQKQKRLSREYTRGFNERLGPNQVEANVNPKSYRSKILRTYTRTNPEERWCELDIGECLMEVRVSNPSATDGDNDDYATNEDAASSGGTKKVLCAFSSLELLLKDADDEDADEITSADEGSVENEATAVGYV